MRIKKLDESELRSWVDHLIGKQTVVGVKEKGGRFVFAPLAAAAELRLDYDVTILPPKKYFLPPQETLLTFSRQGTYSSVLETAPFVLLGVHPYDLVAISQMDAVFAKDNADTHYLARRQAATIVASDVQTMSENVFAGAMGTAVAVDGADLLLTKVGTCYVADPRTKKGKALLAEAGELPNAGRALLARREQLWEDNGKFLRRHDLKCRPADLPALLEGREEHPVWAERAQLCHSCGSCNLVCPTCYCFDVQDDVGWDLQNGTRSRRWDGCLLSDFALVAGGHNFRHRREQRYRHRYYRKGKYLWDRMGQIACVGCGRCITACTTKIANPVDVYNALVEG